MMPTFGPVTVFESALITRAGVERQVDLGLVAETIFFYRSVQLVLNGSSIISLASKIPIRDLISLFTHSDLKLNYLHQNFCVISSGLPYVHDFGGFTFAGRSERKAPRYEDEIALRLEDKLGKNSETRKLIRILIDRVALHRFRETPQKEKIIPDLARDDIADKQFVRFAALAVLRNLVPNYVAPGNFRFEVFNTGQGYAVDTNLDLTDVNRLYHQAVPPEHSSITPAYMLTHIIDARLESYFAAHYMAEIVTTPILSDLIRLKHFDFLRRREINANQIDMFRETILPDVPTIRETINSGNRSIADFLRLLDQAQGFRSWLQSANPEADLIRNYYLAATKKTWAEKLPTKSVRFVTAGGLGVLADLVMPTGLGTIAGLAVGAADSLYLDRLIKGWRPNQFIEGPYLSFVSGEIPRKIA